MKMWTKICLIVLVFLAIPPLTNLGISPSSSGLSGANTHDVNTFSKGDSIKVSESVSVSVNGKSYSVQSSQDNSQSGEFDQNNIITVKANSNSVTTMDKIFNSERLRFNGRTLVRYNPMQSDTYSGKLSAVGDIMAQELDKKNSDLVNGGVSDMSPVIFSGLHSGTIFSGQGTDLPEQLLKLVQDQDYAKYSALLIIVHISGSILICAANPRIAARSKSICSFVFMMILVSSIVTTPMSISGNYVRQAFAEQENNTNESNNTKPLSFNNFSNSTQSLNLSGFSNSTQVKPGLNFNGYSSSTHSLNFNVYSNSTQSLNFNVYSNSTQEKPGLSFNGFSNSTHSLNFNGYSNSTQATGIPNATKSWAFGDANNGTKSVGEVDLQNVANSSALLLQGNGYLTENLTSTRNLSNLTLSAWVKPDYTQGSPAFTIMSAEKQFVFSINNILPPYKMATFSIFDGIRWDTVNSTVPIGQNWNELTATFNGSSIALYVNGTLKSSLHLNGVLAVQVNGNIGTTSIGNITSNGNIAIGAYYDSARQESINKFSGLISNVNLYDSLLTPTQISQLYSQSLSSFYPTLAASVSNSTSTNSTSVNSTSTNLISYNMTSMVDPSINQTQSSYLITQSPQFQFQYISDSNFTKMAHLFRHTNMTQYGGWHDNSTAINVQVVGPDGSIFLTNSTFKEIREGKFDIQLSPTRAAKPGLYNLNLTMVKNGKTYTTQEQYQWGLVSVNTQKSIYRPGETANFTLVVLDNGGQSVCNANIAMRITDPLGSSTTLTSGNGITPESQCGLYDAQYTTDSAGNYTVNITAQNPSGVAYFGTSFLAQNSYPFDIVRTADSKIDPVDNPNSFNVQLDFSSYTNATNVSIQESVPSSFNVTTDGTVQTIGDSKILTWNKDLIGNQTSVQYNYSVPLQYPQLYALGPAQITYGNGQTFAEARPWFVAVDPSHEISVNSGTGTSSPLNFAVTVPSSATHTMGVVSVVVDSASAISGINVEAGTNTACSAGTQTFTQVSGSQASQGDDQIGLWDFAAPSTSDTNICVSWTGTATRVDAGFILVNGTTQAGTIRQANAASGTTGTSTSLPLANSVSGDIIVDAASDLSRTTAISPTDSGHTGLWSQTTTFAAGGGSKNATGADTLTWHTLASGNTWLASGVAFERPFTSIVQNDTIAVSDKAETGKNPEDAIAVTDSPVVSTSIFNSVTVQDSLASQISDKAETGSMVQDTITATDSPSVTTSLSYSVTVQDSLASQLSDKVETGQNPEDAIAVTDSPVVSTSIFNSVTVQDSLASQLSDKVETGNMIQDTVTVTDLAKPTVSTTIQLSDSLSLSDSATTTSSLTQSLSDSLSLSDSATTTSSLTQSLSDSLSLSDITSTPASLDENLQETIPLSDQLVSSAQIQIPLQESLNLTDSSTSAADLAPTQDLVENAQTQIAVNPSQPQLVVVSPNATLSNVTIPSTVTTPSINYSAISTTSGNTDTVQIANPLTVTKYTSNNSPLVQITIPANTSMSGTSWNGVLNLPTIQTGQNLVIPTPSGQTSTVNTVLEVGSGTPMTFDNAVQMILTGQAGQHVGYFYSPTAVTEITTTCADDTQATNDNLPAGGDCKINVGSDLHIWTKHFTGFTTWSSSAIASSGPTSSASSGSSGSSGGGGAGSTGTGPGGAGASSNSAAAGTSSSTETAFGGVLLPQLTIYDVSYDICTNDTAKIVVGTDSDQVPSVILRSSISGVVSAQLDANQPFLTENLNATIKKYLYDVAINPQEKSFEVVALLAENNNVNSAGQTIGVTTCKADITFGQNGQQLEQPIDFSAPQIFDTKFQIANGTKISSSDVAGQYVDNQTLTVYSIINTPTPIATAELRYVPIGQNLTQYSTIEMNVVPLQVSNTTYIVSGTIPSEMMQGSAVNYWVDVQNTAGKTSDSDVYSVGVTQSNPVQGGLELDASPEQVEGSVSYPQAYFTNNGTSPVYGYVTLLVNGSQVFASQPQVFGLGQTQVSLDWKMPSLGLVTSYVIQARAEIYGQTFETESSPVVAFPGTITMPLSKLNTINSISIGNQTVADAYIIHSSFKHDNTVRYKVVSPDGTCVIGADSDCLVTNSTTALGMGSKTVTVNGQLYQVRYSGANSALERFSISSVDPILGQWKVEVESNDSALQTQLVNSVLVQIKYQAHDTSMITLNPK